MMQLANTLKLFRRSCSVSPTQCSQSLAGSAPDAELRRARYLRGSHEPTIAMREAVASRTARFSWGGKKSNETIEVPVGIAMVWVRALLEVIDVVTPLTCALHPFIVSSRRVSVVAAGQFRVTWSTVAFV